MRALRGLDPPRGSVQVRAGALQGFAYEKPNTLAALHRYDRYNSHDDYDREDRCMFGRQILGAGWDACDAFRVWITLCEGIGADDPIKLLASYGLAGLVIIALVIDRRGMQADRKAAELATIEERKAAQAKYDAQADRHRAEMEAFHDRHEAKAENWAQHLSEIAAKNQENDVKIIALLEALLRTRDKRAASKP